MEQIDITRNGRLSAAIAVISGALAVAFLVRSGGAVDLVIGLLLAVIAAAQAYTAWDARLPLLIADAHGIRMRLGRTWAGLPWAELDEVEHLPRAGWLRDGKLVLLPRDEDEVLAGLSTSAKRHATVTERLYGAPLVVPLGISTRVRGLVGSLSSQLADLSQGATAIVEIDQTFLDEDVAGDPADVVTDSVAEPVLAPAAMEQTQVVPVPRITVDEPRTAVIGVRLAAARDNLGLSVDQVSDRTRIRPHIISAIEADEFAACGGDFYARGHLRTLARVLGVDGQALVAQYDEMYADAPGLTVRGFEPDVATLAGSTGGALRNGHSGPNWSVLVAAVMSVVLLWSVARLVFDGASPEPTPAIGLSSGSSGATNPYEKTADAVAVVLTAAGGGAEVVVRGAGGTVVYSGSLAFGQSKSIKAAPPIRVQSSDGSVTVSVAGAKASAVGETGVAGQRIYAGTHE